VAGYWLDFKEVVTMQAMDWQQFKHFEKFPTNSAKTQKFSKRRHENIRITKIASVPHDRGTGKRGGRGNGIRERGKK